MAEVCELQDLVRKIAQINEEKIFLICLITAHYNKPLTSRVTLLLHVTSRVV